MSVTERLTDALENRSLELSVEASEARFVLLSDSHKGIDDGADDFAPCKPVYLEALHYYLERGFTLCVLGDAEELWEVIDPRDIFGAHPETYDLERDFLDAGRYYRVHGNHDELWSNPDQVVENLQPILPGVSVPEGIVLDVSDGGAPLGRFFLAHGHQGDFGSDDIADLARFIVLTVWGTVQRAADIRSTRWTGEVEIAGGHDKLLYYDWAVDQPETILVTGHTHRMVSTRDKQPAELMAMIEKFERRLQSPYFRNEPDWQDMIRRKIAYLRERYQAALLDPRFWPDGQTPAFKPSYFNTGCCAFDNGNISTIEIADGALRMIEWDREDGRRVRGSFELDALFSQVS